MATVQDIMPAFEAIREFCEERDDCRACELYISHLDWSYDERCGIEIALFNEEPYSIEGLLTAVAERRKELEEIE